MTEVAKVSVEEVLKEIQHINEGHTTPGQVACLYRLTMELVNRFPGNSKVEISGRIRRLCQCGFLEYKQENGEYWHRLTKLGYEYTSGTITVAKGQVYLDDKVVGPFIVVTGDKKGQSPRVTEELELVYQALQEFQKKGGTDGWFLLKYNLLEKKTGLSTRTLQSRLVQLVKNGTVERVLNSKTIRLALWEKYLESFQKDKITDEPKHEIREKKDSLKGDVEADSALVVCKKIISRIKQDAKKLEENVRKLSLFEITKIAEDLKELKNVLTNIFE